MTDTVRVATRHRPCSASRFILIILLGVFAGAISGCVGGASERPPKSEVASKKGHWVFPLYSYSRSEEGRKTIRPLFLFPISYGGGSEVASADDYGSGRLASAEAPLWNEKSAGGGPKSAGAVQPGVWGSSLPQGNDTAYVDSGASLGGGREHEVRAGETLYAISRKYYGTGAEWTKIADANRDRVPSPQALSIGTRLRIP
jgi:hypothetical protein